MTDALDVVRIAVCEDSKPDALGLKRFLEHDADLRVVATHSMAEALLASLDEVRPDLIVMDIVLPGMNGLEATAAIMAERPTPIVVLSAYVSWQSELAAAALGAGALDAIGKDAVKLDAPERSAAVALRRRLKRFACMRLDGRAPQARVGGPAPAPERGTAMTVVGVGASTGGPQALATLLGALPRGFPAPVLVVQHLSGGFTEGLARWLDQRVDVPVRVASHGCRARPGVWLAAESRHLVVDPSLHLWLEREPARARHRPSIDVLLCSLAASVGRNAVAVVLTGMGRDGAKGVTAVRAAGGLVVAQDEATSTIFGMPRAAAERGARLLPPAAIAGLLGAVAAPPAR